MFTVLHRNDGVDNFHSADRIERIGPHANTGPEGVVLSTKAAGEAIVLYDGDVFVMNEVGATVATYRIPSRNTGPGGTE
jgi:hypothetical protein